MSGFDRKFAYQPGPLTTTSTGRSGVISEFVPVQVKNPSPETRNEIISPTSYQSSITSSYSISVT